MTDHVRKSRYSLRHPRRDDKKVKSQDDCIITDYPSYIVIRTGYTSRIISKNGLESLRNPDPFEGYDVGDDEWEEWQCLRYSAEIDTHDKDCFAKTLSCVGWKLDYISDGLWKKCCKGDIQSVNITKEEAEKFHSQLCALENIDGYAVLSPTHDENKYSWVEFIKLWEVLGNTYCCIFNLDGIKFMKINGEHVAVISYNSESG